MEETTVVVLGHVDHGKSTLIGRLLYDSGQVQADKVEFARRRSHEQGRDLEFAFLLDGLAEEQEQGITIDFTQTHMRVDDRPFIIADAPGHREFLKNMLSGASRADAAILVIDAEEGVQEQSRRHGYLLSLLGIKQLVVVVNKMDLVDWAEAVFRQIEQEYTKFLAANDIQVMRIIPAAAYTGDNLIHPSPNLPWYQGPTVLEQFSSFHAINAGNDSLRFCVQDVYRQGTVRLLAGRVESGSLRVGQEVIIWPTEEKTRIKAIHCWPQTEMTLAPTGQCVALELDNPLFAERGMIVSALTDQPESNRSFRARVVWLGRKPLVAGNRYKLRLGHQEINGSFESFERVVDVGNLQDAALMSVPAGFVGEGIFVADQPVVFDHFSRIAGTGRFVLVDRYQIAGGGIILEKVSFRHQPDFGRFYLNEENGEMDLFPEHGCVQKHMRRTRNKHHSLVVWFTGLSGAGKSTLARRLEERLFQEGICTYLLDGDNIRTGLNQDLDFSAYGRSENIRRIGEVAKLFVDAGVVVFTAFISPYDKDRCRVRESLGESEFVEVYVKCSLATCEARDTKGLYAKARQGKLKQFTGVDDLYEEPVNPELVIDTELFSEDECVEHIYNYLICRLR